MTKKKKKKKILYSKFNMFSIQIALLSGFSKKLSVLCAELLFTMK